MDKEQKAREYAEQFKVDNAPMGSAIEMGKASKHFKAGYEAGQKGKEFETQVAYNCGREAKQKEIVGIIRNMMGNQLQKFESIQCCELIIKHLENLSK